MLTRVWYDPQYRRRFHLRIRQAHPGREQQSKHVLSRRVLEGLVRDEQVSRKLMSWRSYSGEALTCSSRNSGYLVSISHQQIYIY